MSENIVTWDDLRARIAALEAENERLREAMKPIRAEHESIERWNAWHTGLGQGPCRCRVCKALTPAAAVAKPCCQMTGGMHDYECAHWTSPAPKGREG